MICSHARQAHPIVPRVSAEKTTRVSFLACWQCDQGRATPDWTCPGFRLCFRLLVLVATRGTQPSWDCWTGAQVVTFKVSCILSSKLVATSHVFIFSGKVGHMAKPTSVGWGLPFCYEICRRGRRKNWSRSGPCTAALCCPCAKKSIQEYRCMFVY